MIEEEDKENDKQMNDSDEAEKEKDKDKEKDEESIYSRVTRHNFTEWEPGEPLVNKTKFFVPFDDYPPQFQFPQYDYTGIFYLENNYLASNNSYYIQYQSFLKLKYDLQKKLITNERDDSFYAPFRLIIRGISSMFDNCDLKIQSESIINLVKSNTLSLYNFSPLNVKYIFLLEWYHALYKETNDVSLSELMRKAEELHISTKSHFTATKSWVRKFIDPFDDIILNDDL